MDKYIAKVLTKIENNGYEAYIVGGYVRDYLLGIHSTDIDICTNALPKDLVTIFNNTNNANNYGSIRYYTSNYTFDITTYRSESKYLHRRPTIVKYINNLLEDLERRDFTINAICMSRKGEIIDPLNGRQDIQNKIIRCIGDTKTKLKEDPLRILRAVRFSITLNFTLDSQLAKEIKKNAHLVKSLSYQRKREELDRILLSCHVKEGLSLLKNLNIYEYLEIDYHDIIPINDLCAMYSQLSISPNYQFTKSEKQIINSIKSIVKYGKITNQTLYQYGLYINQLSGKILNIDPKLINQTYENLPIKTIKDLAISYNEICLIKNTKPSKDIKIILNDLINQVLLGNIPNDKSSLIAYIKGGN